MRFGLGLLSLLFSLNSMSYDVPAMISMSPEHIPCPGKVCKQSCTYDADAIIEYQGFEVEGKIKIVSDFDNQTDPNKTKLRTLVRVDVAMVGGAAFWDETNIFDNKSMRLDRTFNYIKVATGSGDSGLKKAEWSQTEFTWPSNFVALPKATLTAIGGKTAADIKKRSSKFYKYLKDSAFGVDWMAEFSAEKPDHKPERDMEDFPENVLSPTFVSMFHLRFIPFVQELRYNLFVNYAMEPRDLIGAFQVGLKGQPGNKANSVVYQGDLAFGDFESQPGKPAKFFVDKSTNQFERIELNMRNLKMGVAATAWTTAVKCN